MIWVMCVTRKPKQLSESYGFDDLHRVTVKPLLFDRMSLQF